MSTPMNPHPHEQQPRGTAMPPRDGWSPSGKQHAAPNFAGAPANAAMPASGANTASFAQARLPKPLGDDGRSTPIGFGRLFSVELRKMLDTRAGKWLLIAMALLITVASLAVLVSGRDSAPRYTDFVAAAGIPMGFILPVLGILAVTSEWSQRTALVTFSLEPRRTRVALGKWAAAGLIGALSIAFAFAIGAIFTLLAQVAFGHGADWSTSWGAVTGNIFAQLIAVSIGIAFGLAFQNTPAGICGYLFIPMLVSIITSFGDAMRTVGKWIDLNLTTQPLYDGTMTGEGWQHFAVSHLLWLVLPMVVGFIRLNKREVKSS